MRNPGEWQLFYNCDNKDNFVYNNVVNYDDDDDDDDVWILIVVVVVVPL